MFIVYFVIYCVLFVGVDVMFMEIECVMGMLGLFGDGVFVVLIECYVCINCFVVLVMYVSGCGWCGMLG